MKDADALKNEVARLKDVLLKIGAVTSCRKTYDIVARELKIRDADDLIAKARRKCLI